MKTTIVASRSPVTVIGGGQPGPNDLNEALQLAPMCVAVDGGANLARDAGVEIAALVGDFDSVTPETLSQIPLARQFKLAEQETTDFGQCLYSTEAPFYVAVGFTGRRIDHMLAVFSAMLGAPDKTVVLRGEAEVAALAPPSGVTLALEPEAIVSVYPVAPVTGVRSEGLEWPVDGLAMEAGHRIGTSNRATQAHVSLAFDRPGALLMLERRFLGALIDAVTA